MEDHFRQTNPTKVLQNQR